MKNNDNTSLDVEHGMAAEGTAAVNSPPRTEDPSSTESLAGPSMVAQKFKNTVLSKIFRIFNLTKFTTQQKALVLLCVARAILDPLFFYIPMINEDSKCMKSDQNLGVIAISLRSLVDVLHFLLWSFYYENKWKVSRLIEILCILPFPQVAAVAILIIKGSPRSQQAVTLLKFSVLCQFVLHAFQVFPSFHEATKNSFTLLKIHFWIGAGFNLLFFVIASHVLGAFWYLLSVGRTMDCWKSACRSQVGCNIDSLYCGGPSDNKSYLIGYCSIQQETNSSAFDFGIYRCALESNIVGSIRFPLKLSYCFWWGLRNLSSLGQNLATSAYEWEICFSICISILGLILFSLFIGNMQAYFQYQTNKDLKNMTDKMDKIMKKQKELSNWQPFQWLPQNLKKEVISCMEDKWLETAEVNLQSMLNNLPKVLGMKIKLEIFSKLMKVKLFKYLNVRVPNSMIDRVKPEVFAKGSHAFRKDQPIDKIVFILNGKVTTQNSTDGSTTQELGVGDFFGEELLKYIGSGSSTTPTNGPPSTADIKACTKVEAFILYTSDFLYLVNRYKLNEDIELWKRVIKNVINKQKKKAKEKPTG